MVGMRVMVFGWPPPATWIRFSPVASGDIDMDQAEVVDVEAHATRRVEGLLGEPHQHPVARRGEMLGNGQIRPWVGLELEREVNRIDQDVGDADDKVAKGAQSPPSTQS